MYTRVHPYEGNDQPINDNNSLECKKRRCKNILPWRFIAHEEKKKYIYIYIAVMTHVNETQGSVQKHSTRWCDVDRKIAQASFLFRSRRFIIIFAVVAICHFITFFHAVFNRVRLSIEQKNIRLTSSRVAKQRLRMIQRKIDRCCTLP